LRSTKDVTLLAREGELMPQTGGSDLTPARLDRAVLLPIAGLVFVALALSIAFVWYSARVQDRVSLENSIDGMAEFLSTRERQLGRVAKDYAWWNDAVRYLQLDPNPDWADRNLGGYVYETFGLEYSLVIDPAGQTVYASADGERADLDAFELVRHGLAELVERARAAPTSNPESAHGLAAADGDVVLIAVSAITPERDDSVAVPPEGRSVLVLAKRLNADYLADFLSVLRVQNLRLLDEAEAAPDSAVLPLVGVDGEVLAQLAWTPDRPGSAMFSRVTPVLGFALLILIVGAARILTYAKRAGDALHASEARFRDVADATSDWIWETDEGFRVVYLSSRFVEAMGMPAEQVLGQRLPDVLHRLPGHEGLEPLLDSSSPPQAFRDVLCGHIDDEGRYRSLKLAGVPIFDSRERHIGYRGTASDITRELEAQSRARFLALHDPLTELANRTLLNERLEHAIARLGRVGDCAAILCIDLDRFKEVNDSLGHSVGDRLLCAVGERLQATVRDTDTVARIGGDEFVVLQVGLKRPDDAQKLCRRLLHALERPFELEGQELIVTVSIGVALLPYDGNSAELVLRNADIALLRAKETGRNTFSFFERGMDARIQQRKTLEREMRAALKAQEFRLVFQPRIDLRRNRLAGVEALVRWQHPERGLLLPGEFISVSEETGLILPLGDWVLVSACAHAAAWDDITVAVNISPVQFKSRRFVATVRRALERSGLEPRRLELEVTEGVLLENTEQSIATLRDLRRLGVRLSMDDFGTGYASLSYLQRFEFDKIKIDRSFVLGLADRMHADAIIRSVLSLGHSLGMEVCAEGVETWQQLEFLRHEGCDEVQGFFFSKPITAGEFEALFLRESWRPPLHAASSAHDRTLNA
jgi:diguanylate cyclase (GGDEF)-like protein/PAS domain S-box-containing protein